MTDNFFEEIKRLDEQIELCHADYEFKRKGILNRIQQDLEKLENDYEQCIDNYENKKKNIYDNLERNYNSSEQNEVYVALNHLNDIDSSIFMNITTSLQASEIIYKEPDQETLIKGALYFEKFMKFEMHVLTSKKEKDLDLSAQIYMYEQYFPYYNLMKDFFGDYSRIAPSYVIPPYFDDCYSSMSTKAYYLSEFDKSQLQQLKEYISNSLKRSLYILEKSQDLPIRTKELGPIAYFCDIQDEEVKTERKKNIEKRVLSFQSKLQNFKLDLNDKNMENFVIDILPRLSNSNRELVLIEGSISEDEKDAYFPQLSIIFGVRLLKELLQDLNKSVFGSPTKGGWQSKIRNNFHRDKTSFKRVHKNFYNKNVNFGRLDKFEYSLDLFLNGNIFNFGLNFSKILNLSED